MTALTIALLAGSDLTSHLILRDLVPLLLERGHQVLVYHTRSQANASRPPWLQRMFFTEHVLLNDHVYPYLEQHGVPALIVPPEKARPAPSAHPRLVIGQATNVNAPEFVAALAEKRIDVSVSVRCYQKFGQPVIGVLGDAARGAMFANLHPGLLPQYRGVLTFARAMAHGDAAAGFTLHHINEQWDAGDIIARASSPLDYDASVLENMCHQRGLAVGLILSLVDDVAAGSAPSAEPQADACARYYSHPDGEVLTALRERGVALARPGKIASLLASEFTPSGHPARSGLRDHLLHALRAAGIGLDDVAGHAGCDQAPVRAGR